ncbi:putative membrane protein (TIGR04086 family) [Bacillus ectoiniformans]|uniref:TIGR04086 family membrane protein n=1 Tax=Bacillus ectoiniformans TaxID=1494429 RepID=UPI00195B46EC|nr:TIGR04086 family membrane protein [Bacillus ectoiniformans]MBM7648987.1 putative membrane protein (TIGR04086 family) [Bacillus ectoiniformans]
MKSFSNSVMYGTMAVFTLAFMCSLLFSLILKFSSFNESSLSMAITLASFLSLFIGGAIAGSKSGRKGWITGGLTGILYSLILILYQFLGYDSLFKWEQMVYHICFIVTAMMGGVLGVNLSKGTKQ